MTSSCTVALTSNYSTQIANMDSDISKRMNVLVTMKTYKLAYFDSLDANPNSSKKRDLTAINSKYNQGFYIQPSYPGIPHDALNANGIDGNFYRNNIVVDFTKQPCLGPRTCHYCQHASQAEKACCACSSRGKASNCTLGTC
jgi:hypothetical protein